MRKSHKNGAEGEDKNRTKRTVEWLAGWPTRNFKATASFLLLCLSTQHVSQSVATSETLNVSISNE